MKVDERRWGSLELQKVDNLFASYNLQDMKNEKVLTVANSIYLITPRAFFCLARSDFSHSIGYRFGKAGLIAKSVQEFANLVLDVIEAGGKTTYRAVVCSTD